MTARPEFSSLSNSAVPANRVTTSNDSATAAARNAPRRHPASASNVAAPMLASSHHSVSAEGTSPRPASSFNSNCGSPSNAAMPTPASMTPSPATSASNQPRKRFDPVIASRYGAAATATIGSIGRMYMSRLPGLALKNSSTSSAHPSGSHTFASRARNASRQRGSSHGNASENGSQEPAITPRKYHGGCWWCQALV